MSYKNLTSTPSTKYYCFVINGDLENLVFDTDKDGKDIFKKYKETKKINSLYRRMK